MYLDIASPEVVQWLAGRLGRGTLAAAPLEYVEPTADLSFMLNLDNVWGSHVFQPLLLAPPNPYDYSTVAQLVERTFKVSAPDLLHRSWLATPRQLLDDNRAYFIDHRVGHEALCRLPAHHSTLQLAIDKFSRYYRELFQGKLRAPVYVDCLLLPRNSSRHLVDRVFSCRNYLPALAIHANPATNPIGHTLAGGIYFPAVSDGNPFRYAIYQTSECIDDCLVDPLLACYSFCCFGNPKAVIGDSGTLALFWAHCVAQGVSKPSRPALLSGTVSTVMGHPLSLDFRCLIHPIGSSSQKRLAAQHHDLAHAIYEPYASSRFAEQLAALTGSFVLYTLDCVAFYPRIKTLDELCLVYPSIRDETNRHKVRCRVKDAMINGFLGGEYQ